jgi:hypothetical protein
MFAKGRLTWIQLHFLQVRKRPAQSIVYSFGPSTQSIEAVYLVDYVALRLVKGEGFHI